MYQTNTNLQSTTSSLNEQYLRKIQEIRLKLQQLLADFSQRCDDITAQAQQKIALIPETDKETRLKIFEEQKNALNLELQSLQKAVIKSHSEARITLESIYSQKEQQQIHQLEEHLAKIFS